MLSSEPLSPAQTQRQGVTHCDFGGSRVSICGWGWGCVHHRPKFPYSPHSFHVLPSYPSSSCPGDPKN